MYVGDFVLKYCIFLFIVDWNIVFMWNLEMLIWFIMVDFKVLKSGFIFFYFKLLMVGELSVLLLIILRNVECLIMMFFVYLGLFLIFIYLVGGLR